ncbi:hypothetical protein GTY65_39930 [Streptomyces sp. SID8379]|uniref:hypothetical protein n=1 Tax=unclassified Streptomyces TaxID=2593676 RepID=UPI00035F90C8|nr:MULTISPECIES: hypothetical protein [unclassified Streptomyces]MYW70180.1 hypothetical protein [Streptomyces sp. SID8379]
MATRIDFTFGDDGSREHVVLSSDQLARVLAGVLRGEVLLSDQVGPGELWRDIAAVTELLERLEDWRERAVVAVDETGAVDRDALGIAAKMGAARLYELLERHGRPRNQTRLTQVEALESRVTSEDGEWDPVRVVDTMSSYGWDIDDKRARALLRTLSEQEVLEKIPGRGGRAVYRIPGARDWLYCLDPELNSIDGGPATPARVARMAREKSGPTWWWLGRPLTKMRDGDRLWFYFGGVEAKVAAMAHVKSSPRPASADTGKPYEVEATLDPEATAALRKSPVRLEEMEQQHPQGCGQMRASDAKLASTRAGL